MKEQVEVSIYNLKGGGFQVSYLNPISQKRIRHKFQKYQDAQNFERKIHSQFLTDSMTGFSHIATEEFLKAYLLKYPKAKMVTRGKPFYLSFSGKQSGCQKYEQGF